MATADLATAHSEATVPLAGIPSAETLPAETASAGAALAEARLAASATPPRRDRPARAPRKLLERMRRRQIQGPILIRLRAHPVHRGHQANPVREIRFSAVARSSGWPAPAKTKPFASSTRKSTTISGSSSTIRVPTPADYSPLQINPDCSRSAVAFSKASQASPALRILLSARKARPSDSKAERKRLPAECSQGRNNRQSLSLSSRRIKARSNRRASSRNDEASNLAQSDAILHVER